MSNTNLIKSAIISVIIAFFIIPLPVSADMSLDSIAENYVRIVLQVGQYDEYMVDSYFGPEELKPSKPISEGADPPYDEFVLEAKVLAEELNAVDSNQLAGMQLKRYWFLRGQIASLIGRIQMLTGNVMPFDVETRTMYGIELPDFNKVYYDSLLEELGNLLPGEGSVADRFNFYQAQMRVPLNKVERVFRTGMKEAQVRVSKHIAIPDPDSISIEVVHEKQWTADCRYQRNGHSHMQFNVDNPFYLDEAITFPCHELYPGHHLSFLYIDKYLFEENGWVEYSIVPCFSPFTGMLEGIAEYGIELTFPKAEWIEFVKDRLCPIAGIDTGFIDSYYDMWKLKYRLYSVESYVARQYLSGEIDSTEAKDALLYYAIYGTDEVDDRIGFYDDYRSYVVTYYIGIDLIRNHIEAITDSSNDPEAKWEAFAELLKTPLTPANLLSRSK